GLDGRLPSIASFTCDDVDGELLVVLLDRAGVAAATGSACSTGSTEPSHVLTAMGIDATTARGALRLSLASNVTGEDIALLSERIPTCIRKARLISSTR
ncbi:MAG: aminotransferase class V-fold PLP-dependent enzyme, partial [Collinsella intestinalis]